MKEGTRIEVHFKTGAGKEHVVVIKPGSKVNAIMLKPSKPPRERIPDELVRVQPELASIAGAMGPACAT